MCVKALIKHATSGIMDLVLSCFLSLVTNVILQLIAAFHSHSLICGLI